MKKMKKMKKINKYKTLPAEVALFSEGSQREVILSISARRNIQVPLDLLAVQYLKFVYCLEGKSWIHLRELTVPRAVKVRHIVGE